MCPWGPAQSGSAGAIIEGEGCNPSVNGTVIFLQVNDIESTLERMNTNGGSTVLPKTSIGEHGHFAQFNDTEGKKFALHSD